MPCSHMCRDTDGNSAVSSLLAVFVSLILIELSSINYLIVHVALSGHCL